MGGRADLSARSLASCCNGIVSDYGLAEYRAVFGASLHLLAGYEDDGQSTQAQASATRTPAGRFDGGDSECRAAPVYAGLGSVGFVPNLAGVSVVCPAPSPPSWARRIWLIHVRQPASFLAGETTSPLIRSDQQAGQAEHHLLDKPLRQNVSLARRGGTLVRFGVPDHEIVEAARELGMDLIIMTTHGYQGLQHLLHPSISERVVRHAPCPVLTLTHATLQKLPTPED